MEHGVAQLRLLDRFQRPACSLYCFRKATLQAGVACRFRNRLSEYLKKSWDFIAGKIISGLVTEIWGACTEQEETWASTEIAKHAETIKRGLGYD